MNPYEWNMWFKCWLNLWGCIGSHYYGGDRGLIDFVESKSFI